MKYLVQVCRFLVGGVFVFSGLIKLNDPVGTQIKLEEYFDVFAQDMAALAPFWEALVPLALPLSVFLCSLEVVLGVALLLSYRPRLTATVLLALCVFFAFLTFYSAYFNKVTDCGCFGEMIKLEPWTSFWKDIILLVLILVMLAGIRYLPRHRTGGWVAAATLACVALGVYAVRYLPPYDGLPYAVGQHIPANRRPSAPLRFKYVVTRDGQSYEFEQYPTDTTYRFKEMIPLNPEANPRITDYRLWTDDADFTEESLRGAHLFVITQDVSKASTAHLDEIRALTQSLAGTAVRPALLTASSGEALASFQRAHNLSLPFYYADYKVLKTIVRSNPGVWLIVDGTVRGKWSHAAVPSKETVLEKVAAR
jgi:uncharacterized membrane protein YphA (DoxX/SURF4 family)